MFNWPADSRAAAVLDGPETNMPTYKTQLKNRAEIAEGTMAFFLEKPRDFQFKPGQHLDLTLLDPPEIDSEGAVRTFSIASAPYERDLVVATRMRDTAFKRVMARLPFGTELKFDGPMGSFTLHKTPSKAAVFLAGGIGITPFRSILRQANQEKSTLLFYLFYSNQRPEDAAFLDELQELSKSSPRFIFIPSMSEIARSKKEWTGERGLINWEMLAKHFCELKGPIYYIAGPPSMVSAMRQMLIKAEISDDDIRTEEFRGYSDPCNYKS
jgi:ferredoxin-NADP reductase